MQLKKLNKKTYYIVSGVIALLLVGTPTFVNFLMSFRIVKVYGDTNTWIGFLGTYIGSVISGFITLVGVLLTIKFTERESKKAIDFTKAEARKEKLPVMIANVEECIDYLDDCMDEMAPLQGRVIEDHLYKEAYRRTLYLFEIDYNYSLKEKPDLKKIKKEYVKRIRNYIVKIDANAYNHFRQFDHKLRKSYLTHISPINNRLLYFESSIMTNYMDTHDMILVSNDGKLIDIDLADNDTKIFNSIRGDLYYREIDFLADIEDAYSELKLELEHTLMLLTEEFSR